MNLALLVAAAVCTVNPVRAQAVLPAVDRRAVAATGAAVALAVVVLLALAAESLLDAADVAAPTLRMGLGVVLLLQGAAAAVARLPRPEPALAGRRAALVPVAFPVLLTPGLGVLAVAGAVDRGGSVAVIVLAGALLLAPALAAAVPRPGPVARRVGGAVARLLAGALVVAGVALVMDGLFDI